MFWHVAVSLQILQAIEIGTGMNYLYILLDLGTISIPLIVTFHPRLKFYKKWKSLFLSTGITGAFFIVWDVWFTQMEYWGFNPDYLLGLSIANLPIEEWLFFICVPYACVFTYDAVLVLKPSLDYSNKLFYRITFFFIALASLLFLLNYDKWYTFVNFLTLSVVLFVGYRKFPVILKRFYPIFCLILVPFIIVNGVLTGSVIQSQVVWYDDMENLGIRFFTIPIEDFGYAFSLIFSNLMLLHFFEEKRLLKKEAL
jgi:lycopene cyclase domain-containing protein